MARQNMRMFLGASNNWFATTNVEPFGSYGLQQELECVWIALYAIGPPKSDIPRLLSPCHRLYSPHLCCGKQKMVKPEILACI